LTGDNVGQDSVYKSYVRTCGDDLTAVFDESFELGPLNSMSMGLSIKIFDKKITRIIEDDRCIVETVLPAIRDESKFGRTEEIVSWITLSSETMFDDTGEIQIGLKLK
jgi:hypothetical protein